MFQPQRGAPPAHPVSRTLKGILTTVLVPWMLASTQSVTAITMDKLQFDLGDFLIYSVLGKENNCNAPHHYMIAMSQYLAFDVHIVDANKFWCSGRILDKRQVPNGLKNHMFETKKIKDKYEIIGWEKTLTLALRLQGVKLPYNTLNCNCKHYAFYLVYGRTYARRTSLTYQTPASDCPVANRIERDTDVSKDDFQLKSSDGMVWEIKSLTKEKKQWIDERLGRKPKKGSSSKASQPPSKAPSQINRQPGAYPSPTFRTSNPSPAPSPSRPVAYGGYGTTGYDWTGYGTTSYGDYGAGYGNYGSQSAGYGKYGSQSFNYGTSTKPQVPPPRSQPSASKPQVPPPKSQPPASKLQLSTPKPQPPTLKPSYSSSGQGGKWAPGPQETNKDYLAWQQRKNAEMPNRYGNSGRRGWY